MVGSLIWLYVFLKSYFFLLAANASAGSAAVGESPECIFFLVPQAAPANHSEAALARIHRNQFLLELKFMALK